MWAGYLIIFISSSSLWSTCSSSGHPTLLRQSMITPKNELTIWFNEEVNPHEGSLKRYLRSKFPSLPDIDDLVQESYARLIQARTAGRISYAKAFLFTTARNIALDIFRRRQVVQIEHVADMETLNIQSAEAEAGETLERQEKLKLLAEAVKSLPVRCRQVMTLRLLYAMPQKQIAHELKISEHTVKAQLAKGMRRCAEFFTERGLT